MKVTQEGRYGQPVVKVALKGLRVLKTTQSAFVNFVDDEYRYFYGPIRGQMLDTHWFRYSVLF